MPSPTTINRRAKKYGHKLKQFLPDCVAGTDADAVIPDGTKCHSQDDDRSSHSVQATLGEDTAEESRSLLDLSVNADWDETAAELDDIGAVTDDATVVSDADSGIVTAFTDENRDHQLDLVHVGRTLGYTLWDDGVFSLDRRKEIVSEVIDEVFHLKNSVAKHRPAEEFAAIRSRIARTRERLEKTAWQLEQFGSAKAAGYLRRWLPSIVTFAEHAVEGFEVPWTSNPVERLMGEVSKRCKNQWMRWTAEGLEAILQLRLVKYADPEYYQAFLDELLQRSTKTAINCDLSIESTSGKVCRPLCNTTHFWGKWVFAGHCVGFEARVFGWWSAAIFGRRGSVGEHALGVGIRPDVHHPGRPTRWVQYLRERGIRVDQPVLLPGGDAWCAGMGVPRETWVGFAVVAAVHCWWRFDAVSVACGDEHHTDRSPPPVVDENRLWPLWVDNSVVSDVLGIEPV